MRGQQKQIHSKRLIDTKVTDFIGIQENVDPLSDRKSVVKCTNIEPHVEPGLFTLREPYQLKYLKPTDPVYDRNNGEEFISFDNFYEKTARDQAEVTVLVSKAEIQAPMVGGSRITEYTFNSVNIYIRPHWTGSYWDNSWLWLNEPIITKILSQDATYKNKIKVSGYFDNLLQWTLVNVTKDKTLPYAILRSAQNGSDTDLWISAYDPGFDADDEVVLMRNYIPIKYLLQNYNVLREEISFHRVLSRMRIGFGGKDGRVGLGVDYVKRTLQLADYNFTNTDPDLVDKEFYFANNNRMVVQPYTQFNESKRDFILTITNDGTGTLPANVYYFRAVAKLDGDVNQVLVAEAQIDCPGITNNLSAQIRILAGSLSRRLSGIDLYYSTTGLDYYFWRGFVISVDGDYIAGTLVLDDSGYLLVQEANTEIYTESSAVSAGDANSLGSWYAKGSLSEDFTVVAGTAPDNYAIKDTLSGTPAYGMTFLMPITGVDQPRIQVDVPYDVELDFLADNTGILAVGIVSILEYSGTQLFNWISKSASVITTIAKGTYTLTFTMTTEEKLNLERYMGFGNVMGIAVSFNREGNLFCLAGDTATLERFSIKQTVTPPIDVGTELGSEMSEALGYTPTFNLVKDWQNAVYLNGRTYVAPAFIEKRYDTYVFGSMINGDGANMHDVIPAAGLVFPIDEFRGEVVVGMVVMHNLNIAMLTDGGLVILDPDTGNTRELARGYGCKIKTSIVVFRGSIIYGSDDDFIEISAATGYQARPKSERSVRKIYNDLPDKLKVQACFDRFGTYHAALGVDAEYRELLLTNRGWIDQNREHYPEVFRNGLGGRVWFLNEGDIYALPYNEEEFIGYADLYGDYRAGW